MSRKRNAKPKQQLLLYIEQELVEDLTWEAEDLNRSRNSYIIHILKERTIEVTAD